MRQYISEDEAYYMDAYHGQFSRKLAKWAIDNMKVKDPATGKMAKITPRAVDDVEEIMHNNGIEVPDKCIYTCWYLFNMAIADYPKTCKTDTQRATFVEETLLDPDGDPSNVLDCFVTKMCNAGIPVYWERFL
ncbi:MAG: hypothetical protein IJ588_12475 [Prevotella sp.]|nr:hypothetical protein [Prevotella sp.]